MNTYYEWDYETVEDNEVIEHNHSDKLSKFIESDKTDTLVLVRNSGNESCGLDTRHWAYVCKGKLPTYFKDSRDMNTPFLVPKRFHNELAKYLSAPVK